MTPALNEEELKLAMQDLPEWSGNLNGIIRRYQFSDFPAAIAFMHKLVDAIEAEQHHPEWTNIYNTVSVRLRTHDADNQVTAKDIKLAHLLEDAAS
jgi:4a-hydroxytetrahydrobiopterin dehydratase